MTPAPTYDLPLEALKPGEHAFAYELDDAFFAAYESPLVAGGAFRADLTVERVANQFTLDLHLVGQATVACDRCLGAFALPLDVRDELVIKFANGPAREADEVVYLPFGTDTYDVAKLILDAVGLALPIQITHDAADLACDPSVTQFLLGDEPAADDESDGGGPASTDIPADSPWQALRGLRADSSDN